MRKNILVLMLFILTIAFTGCLSTDAILPKSVYEVGEAISINFNGSHLSLSSHYNFVEIFYLSGDSGVYKIIDSVELAGDGTLTYVFPQEGKYLLQWDSTRFMSRPENFYVDVFDKEERIGDLLSD